MKKLRERSGQIIFYFFFAIAVFAPALQAEDAGADQFARINRKRLEFGLPELKRSTELDKIAQTHADRLGESGELSHLDPGTGKTLEDRIRESAFFAGEASENAGTGQSSSGIFEKFLESEKHRGNILDAQPTHVGIGWTTKKGVLYIVQDFACPIELISSSDAAKSIFAAMNTYRDAHHFPPLRKDDRLEAIAMEHTKSMIEGDRLYFPSLPSGQDYKIFCFATPSIEKIQEEMNLLGQDYKSCGLDFELAKTPTRPMGIWWGTVVLGFL
jgi:uncharacterized protein YkwD